MRKTTDDLGDIVTYSQARARLAELMDRVVGDRAPVTITRQKAPPVIMLSKEDFDSMRETIYLLSSPNNARRLLGAVADADARRYAPPPRRRRTKR